MCTKKCADIYFGPCAVALIARPNAQPENDDLSFQRSMSFVLSYFHVYGDKSKGFLVKVSFYVFRDQDFC